VPLPVKTHGTSAFGCDPTACVGYPGTREVPDFTV
jgi:hypothetical protein